MSNENQSSLEDQRTFLLNSIRELDEEFAVGDLDQDDYQSLRSDYVSRTAEVIKQIESPQTTSTVSQTPRDATQFTRLRKNLLTLLIVIVVAVGSGWLVAQQSGQRLSGQSLTGGIEDSTASLLSRARATNFIDPKAAIDLY